MADLLRLICAVLALLAGSAFASVPMTDHYYITNVPTKFYSSAQQACEVGGATLGGVPPATVFGDGSCLIYAANGSPITMVWRKTSMCPENSAAGGNSCVCNSGTTEQGGQCVLGDESADKKCAGDFVMAGFGVGMGSFLKPQTMNGVVPSGEFCWPYSSPTSGCLMIFNRDKLTAMSDGSVQSTGTFSMYKAPAGQTQGKSCTIENTDSGSTVEEKCDQKGTVTTSSGTKTVCADAPKCEGGFAGERNGVEVCVTDGGNVIETSKDTIKKNEDGSTDKSTEKTTCKGNVCTTEKTTTTTTNNNTSSSSSTTKTESREDYCKANANAAQCKGEDDKDKGKFGGSCSAGFTCEGDVLQCAIAKDQHRRNCQMFDDKTTESQLYDSENAKGSNRDVTKDLPGNTEVDVSGKLSSEDVLGGGRCIADLSVQVWRSSVVLPFSKVCPSLGYLGWVLVSVCSLAAFRIVSGPSKED